MAREKNPTTQTPRKPAARKTTVPTLVSARASFVGPEQRASLIAEAAYFRAERRGFMPGQEMDDWLTAEAEIDSRLMRGVDSTSSA